jgi:hypothetical protein
MANNIDSGERSYRSGLILGLTMAEIMVLILFALLLVWMVGTRKSIERELDLKTAGERIRQLQEERRILIGSDNGANAFDDTFRELTVARAQIAELQKRVEALEDVSKLLRSAGYPMDGSDAAQNAAKDIRERLAIASKIVSGSKGIISRGSQQGDSHNLQERIAELARIDDAIKKVGLQQKTSEGMVINAILRQSELPDRVKTLEGRLKNAELQLATAGKGTEKPACWADSVSGKPEYIFDVALNSQTVLVHDNALPQRQQEEASLPLQVISFDKNLQPQEFRTATRVLFEWSEKEGCRFFVRVFDLTQADEKDPYKHQLRTVGEHFYYFEDLTNSWEKSHVRAAN